MQEMVPCPDLHAFCSLNGSVDTIDWMVMRQVGASYIERVRPSLDTSGRCESKVDWDAMREIGSKYIERAKVREESLRPCASVFADRDNAVDWDAMKQLGLKYIERVRPQTPQTSAMCASSFVRDLVTGSVQEFAKPDVFDYIYLEEEDDRLTMDDADDAYPVSVFEMDTASLLTDKFSASMSPRSTTSEDDYLECRSHLPAVWLRQYSQADAVVDNDRGSFDEDSLSLWFGDARDAGNEEENDVEGPEVVKSLDDELEEELCSVVFASQFLADDLIENACDNSLWEPIEDSDVESVDDDVDDDMQHEVEDSGAHTMDYACDYVEDAIFKALYVCSSDLATEMPLPPADSLAPCTRRRFKSQLCHQMSLTLSSASSPSSPSRPLVLEPVECDLLLDWSLMREAVLPCERPQAAIRRSAASSKRTRRSTSTENSRPVEAPPTEVHIDLQGSDIQACREHQPTKTRRRIFGKITRTASDVDLQPDLLTQLPTRRSSRHPLRQVTAFSLDCDSPRGQRASPSASARESSITRGYDALGAQFFHMHDSDDVPPFLPAVAPPRRSNRHGDVNIPFGQSTELARTQSLSALMMDVGMESASCRKFLKTNAAAQPVSANSRSRSLTALKVTKSSSSFLPAISGNKAMPQIGSKASRMPSASSWTVSNNRLSAATLF